MLQSKDHLEIVCGVLFKKVLDPLVVYLEVGDLGPVGRPLLLTRFHPVKHRRADTRNQAPATFHHNTHERHIFFVYHLI